MGNTTYTAPVSATQKLEPPNYRDGTIGVFIQLARRLRSVLIE